MLLAKISKLEDVLVKASADLQKATQISAAKIENIKEQACNLLYPIKVISGIVINLQITNFTFFHSKSNFIFIFISSKFITVMFKLNFY